MGRYKKYLAIFLMFSIHMMPFNARAASGEETVDMLRKKIQIMSADIQDTRKKVVGYKRSIKDIVNEAGAASTVVKHHVAETVPTKTKIGKPMLERAKAFKGGIAGVVGGAAITGLIEAVGWVMEEGTFVKYKEIEDEAPPQKIWIWTGCGSFSSCNPTGYANKNPQVICDTYGSKHPSNLQTQDFLKTSETTGSCTYKNTTIKVSLKLVDYFEDEEPKKEKIYITDDHVGGIILGDYVDPVDENYNDTSKKWKDGPVVAAYTEDPNGIGNEASDEMERKLDNAPPTPDGKPAPPGDSRYQNQEPTEEEPNINDRSWEDTGGKAEGESNPKTDPETGEQTGGQNISLQFPVFCEWAHKVCSWYDDWKVSDKVYKDHLKKTEDHQTQQKTFWQKVTDFFTFIKTNDLDEDTEIEIEDDQTETVDTDIAFASGCPVFPIQAQWHGFTLDFTIDLTNMCDAFSTIVKPIVISMATFSSIYILAGVRNDE
ncbi:hypothetical protein [Acinetobacter haemolyticus]|uniref:hypothetical protein n=1 Tax=Acinetobacter haemolyticus TaxID=29430 RepID=UPI000E11B60C|nr:hypothetical protein [Acinetobacter haemolyticus]SUU22803.1 Uncharacterised protein [Acinetobacter haemolyticus]